MKKSVVILAIAVIGVIAYTQRATIAMRIMAVGAERAMTENVIESLDDGLHVALCGAGGPLPDPKRSGPCIAVVAGEQLFIVDAGTNGLRNLIRMRHPAGDIASGYIYLRWRAVLAQGISTAQHTIRRAKV